MQTFTMSRNKLPEFTEGLKKFGKLWAPVEKHEGVFSLEPITDVNKSRPDALRTILPFKKLLLKPLFPMLKTKKSGSIEECGDNEGGSQVFFGAHSCDIHALKILDLLYLSNYEDTFYKKNREKLVVVGFGCTPDEKCFCQSMNTSTTDSGFDMFLTPLKDKFLVTVSSAKGDEIISAFPEFFSPSASSDVRDYLERINERRSSFKLTMDTTDLPYILEIMKDDNVWEELGKKCLCCGSCSIVCPTCSCFNVMDEKPSEDEAVRLRAWDACLYKEYAVVAGGHNFRANRADRVKNRYYHKHEAFVREFGMPSCVGCGRCIENCPAGISVVEVFDYVRGKL